MIIIGCDYHPGFQQIAFVDTETGELQERRLQHREEGEDLIVMLLSHQHRNVRNDLEDRGRSRQKESPFTLRRRETFKG
jgi:hypothetical protein